MDDSGVVSRVIGQAIESPALHVNHPNVSIVTWWPRSKAKYTASGPMTYRRARFRLAQYAFSFSDKSFRAAALSGLRPVLVAG